MCPDKHFSRTDHVKRHVRKVHLKLREKIEKEKIKCDKCDYSTSCKKNFSRHYSRMHGENTNQILRCEKCDYTTNIQENLARHLKTVGLYNFAILIKSK